MRICVLSDVHCKYAAETASDRLNEELTLSFLKESIGKYDLMVLNGDTEYSLHFNDTDVLSDAQRHYAENQYSLFRQWYKNWSTEQNVA